VCACEVCINLGAGGGAGDAEGCRRGTGSSSCAPCRLVPSSLSRCPHATHHNFSCSQEECATTTTTFCHPATRTHTTHTTSSPNNEFSTSLVFILIFQFQLSRIRAFSTSEIWKISMQEPSLSMEHKCLLVWCTASRRYAHPKFRERPDRGRRRFLARMWRGGDVRSGSKNGDVDRCGMHCTTPCC
jgi:hypothetical protein